MERWCPRQQEEMKRRAAEQRQRMEEATQKKMEEEKRRAAIFRSKDFTTWNLSRATWWQSEFEQQNWFLEGRWMRGNRGCNCVKQSVACRVCDIGAWPVVILSTLYTHDIPWSNKFWSSAGPKTSQLDTFNFPCHRRNTTTSWFPDLVVEILLSAL